MFTHDLLARSVNELVELQEIKSILSLPTFHIHLVQELLDQIEHARDLFLIRITFRGVLLYNAEKKWITRQTRCRLR